MTEETKDVTPEEIAELQAAEKARLDELDDQDLSDLKPEPVASVDPMDADTNGLGDDGPDYGDVFEDDDEELEDMVLVREPVVLDNGHIEITLNLTLSQVGTLQDGLDLAAATLGRYGMEAMYILATEPSTGRRWVVHGDSIFQEPDERE